MLRHLRTYLRAVTAAMLLMPSAVLAASSPDARADSAAAMSDTAAVSSPAVTTVRSPEYADSAVTAAYLSAKRPLDLPRMSLIPPYDILTTPADSLSPMTGWKPDRRFSAKPAQQSVYAFPYSLTGTCYDWHRLWVNTGVLAGAFVGTLFVLECLPEDATSWNRAELQKVPLFKRWHNHVISEGPEWDHDKFIFNYVLHPYAGAAYFMAARSCGFNFYQSMLYSTIISNIGWEFGIEAFMERPSYQDLFITPLVGSTLGEGFYRLKRHLVDNDYCLFGSPVLGNIVAFLIDPVNEVIGLFHHNPARAVARTKAWQRAGDSHGRKATVSFTPSWNCLCLKVTF